MDVMAGLVVGIFFVTVAAKGNSQQALQLAIKDKAFLKWAIAVGLLNYLRGIPNLRGPVTLLITAAFIGLFLLSGSSISAEAKKFWASLGTATASSNQSGI